MKKNQRNYRTSVSGISVLMVFLILCIAIFAILTLSAAQAEWHLTQKSQHQVETYYACDALAQQKLAEMDDQIRRGGIGSLPVSDYWVTGSTVVFETAEVNNRKMYVKAEIVPGGFEIRDYRLINTQPSDYDDGTLDVLQ